MAEIQDEINEVLKDWRDRIKGRIVQAAVDIAVYENEGDTRAPAEAYEKLKDLLDDLFRAESVPAIPAFIAQTVNLAGRGREQATETGIGPTKPKISPDS